MWNRLIASLLRERCINNNITVTRKTTLIFIWSLKNIHFILIRFSFFFYLCLFLYILFVFSFTIVTRQLFIIILFLLEFFFRLLFLFFFFNFRELYLFYFFLFLKIYKIYHRKLMNVSFYIFVRSTIRNVTLKSTRKMIELLKK